MASEHTPTNAQLRRRFKRGLQILLDTFYDTMLLYTQDIQVVNFSDISRGFVNVIIMYKDVEGRSAHAAEIHPVQMTKILRDVFQDPQLAHKYAKHLDKKVQVDSSVSQEPEIVPDPESSTDTPYWRHTSRGCQRRQSAHIEQLHDQWDTIYSPLLTFKYNQKNRKLFSLTSPLRRLKEITPS